jgi:zinc transporter
MTTVAPVVAADAKAPTLAQWPGSGPLHGLIWAFRIHADGAAEELPVDGPIDDRHDGWLWLHFNLADTRACQWIKAAPGICGRAAGLLVDHGQHQQLHVDDGCVYGVFGDLVRGLDGATPDIGFLHFAMTERVLISGRRDPLNAVEATRRRLQAGHRLPTVAALLELIIDHVVEAVDGYEDELAVEIDAIEEQMLTASLTDERQRLSRIRRTTVRLHRQLAGLRTLLHRIEKEMGSSFSAQMQIATTRLSQRLDGLDHDIVAMRDRAYLLQEEVTLKIGEETNRHLQVLAVVTVLLMPATVITGIFGMNVKGLPFTDNESGFLLSAGLLVGGSILAYLALKWMGVLGRK